MFRKLLLLTILAFASPPSFSEPAQGDVRDINGVLEVWHTTPTMWVSPDRFFQIELTRLNGPTYGSVKEYPPYDSVQEWETLVDILPDGRSCPMVFFHSRWRRLPDVLALDERLRNYGGCRDAFKF